MASPDEVHPDSQQKIALYIVMTNHVHKSWVYEARPRRPLESTCEVHLRGSIEYREAYAKSR